MTYPHRLETALAHLAGNSIMKSNYVPPLFRIGARKYKLPEWSQIPQEKLVG